MLHRAVSIVVAGLAIAIFGSAGAFASTVVTIPEPASLAVLAAGVGALAWVKFRRRG